MPDLASVPGLVAAGRLTEAERIGEAALRATPGNVAALHALAVVRRHQGRIDEAEFLLTAALGRDADYADALNDLGAIWLDRGEAARALGMFQRALDVDSSHPGAAFNAGHALRALGREAEAEAAYLAIPDGPAWAGARLNAAQLRRPRDGAGAIALYREVLDAAPDNAVAWNDLGVALLDAGRWLEGMACLRRATALHGEAGMWLNLGNGELLVDAAPPALAAFERSVAARVTPESAHNLAATLLLLNRAAKAAEAFCRAASVGGGDRAIFGQALATLVQGRLAEGFELYESRLTLPDIAPLLPRHTIRPRWHGSEPVAGKTLLVPAEQGHGDTIQFGRYLPLVAALGARLVVEAPAIVLPILRSVAPDETYVMAGEMLPGFDLYCPMMSLARAFARETVPTRVPYLVPGADRIARWRPEMPDGPVVGIVWAGNPEFKNDKRRSMPLASLTPLFGAARVVSLQTPVRAADAAILERHGIPSLGPDLVDFADTAAVITLLDLVVTVDTAVAHLAGALGKPVWTMLPYAPDWRWLLERNDSPWYPTMRLYRQTRPGDWAGVVERVAADLIRFRKRASRGGRGT